MNSPITRLSDLRGLKATVMGLGLNGGGVASALFLARNGADVTVTDMKDEEALTESIAMLSDFRIRFVLGRHELTDFTTADIVIKNPAVRPDSPYLAASKAIETDLSLFLRFSQSPIIAVTGSKGKSTVASAIHHSLVTAGCPSLLGGNIAVSPLSFFSDTRKDILVVLELSSWQLADMRGMGLLRPRIALLTSIMPDHMNRYRTMEDYIADKRLIYADQDDSCYTICNSDDPWGHSFAAETRAHVLWYASAFSSRPGAWFCGHDAEARGLCSLSGYLSDSEEILGNHLLVSGYHQRKNLLSAALACRCLGIEAPVISASMASFPGIEHRLERFAEREGITWINDSAATIPQAVAAALESIADPIILITGGTDKNLDFESIRIILKKPRAIILLSGTGTEKLRAILNSDSIDYLGPFDTLDTAVTKALSTAHTGDTVILSPGCTSFGMFLNEFDRGRRFKETVFSSIGIS